MVVGMNASKNKGDRAEREAVEVLKELASDLVLPNAMRKLGAGRREDTGDLHVFSDVTIQVKSLKNPVAALRAAASGALVQSERAQTRWHLGMAPLPRARKNGIHWLCVTSEWPTSPIGPFPQFGTTGTAIEYIRSDSKFITVVPTERLAMVTRQGKDSLFISSVDAWVDALRVARLVMYSLAERSL
jgi:hypothetical protein